MDRLSAPLHARDHRTSLREVSAIKRPKLGRLENGDRFSLLFLGGLEGKCSQNRKMT